MGYVVLHLDKAQRGDSKMSSHIERKNHPENADATRTHLNKELIDFPEGVENRVTTQHPSNSLQAIYSSILPLKSPIVSCSSR